MVSGFSFSSQVGLEEENSDREINNYNKYNKDWYQSQCGLDVQCNFQGSLCSPV